MRELLLPGVVFLLTAMLATNQGGLGESVIGVLAVMIASGLGLLATVTAKRRPMRFALCVAAVLAASALSTGVSGRLIHVERSFFGVVRVTHDAEQKRAPAISRDDATRTAKPRARTRSRTFDLLHSIRADRPRIQVAWATSGANPGRELRSWDWEQGRWLATPGRTNGGHFMKSIRSSRGLPGIRGSLPI